MDNNTFIRKWSDLHGLAVVTGGRQIGTVDDFYLEPETNAVRALRINMGVYGYRLLQASAIRAIEQNAITITSEHMLAEEKTDGRLPALLPGKRVLSYKIVSEKGTVLGEVENVLIDTSTPMALRVVAFVLEGGSNSRNRNGRSSFPASEVTRYERDTIVILDRVARR